MTDGSGNLIGGTGSGAGNVIAFNNNFGVDVDSGTGNAIRQDLIYNTGQAIFLNPTTSANNNQAAATLSAVDF